MELDNWILKKLFGPDGESKLADPETAQYFHDVGLLGADQLAVEPERLAEEKVTLQEETENLAFSNYRTFIQAANCSKDIFDDFILVNQHLDGVLSQLPDLASECQNFVQEAQNIGRYRAKNTLTLNKHPQLLEILEIPQVMDTCVRAGYWEEALELAQHVTKLQRRLSHIPVIQHIGNEVAAQRQLLVEQLLDQLHVHLTLPQCLKVVGYLRRLAVFTEAELRIKFLLARDQWFRSVLVSIPMEDSYQYITKVMEQSRIHLFDVSTQYKAVFADDDPLSLPLPPVGFGSFASVGREELPTNLSAIFQSWIFEKVQEFLSTLESALSRGVGERLDSVLAQTMYFGLSFGRIGADFRSLVCPIFERAAFQEFQLHLDNATARLISLLSSDAFLNGQIHVGSHKATSLTPQTETPLSPPISLMDWTPLAVYCNQILSVFNDIRLCLPLTLATHVTRALQNSLNTVTEALSAVAEMNSKEWSGEKRLKFEAICTLLAIDLAPFLNVCLENLFPIKVLTALLGLSAGNQTQVAWRINLETIRDSLQEFLPKIVIPAILDVESSEPEMTSSTQEVTSLDEKMTSSEKEVTSLNEDMTSLLEEVASMKEKVKSSDQEVTSLGHEVTSSDQRVTSSNQEVTSSDQVTSSVVDQIKTETVLFSEQSFD